MSDFTFPNGTRLKCWRPMDDAHEVRNTTSRQAWHRPRCKRTCAGPLHKSSPSTSDAGMANKRFGLSGTPAASLQNLLRLGSQRKTAHHNKHKSKAQHAAKTQRKTRPTMRSPRRTRPRRSSHTPHLKFHFHMHSTTSNKRTHNQPEMHTTQHRKHRIHAQSKPCHYSNKKVT